MPYDYFQENSGYVSLWLGNFQSEAQLDEYLSTVYWDFDSESESQFRQKLNRLFLPQNKDRSCENAFKQRFDEHYNRFEYDFGLWHDEDFRERGFHAVPTNDPLALVAGHSYYQTFQQHLADRVGNSLETAYNSVVLIYDCRYDGAVTRIVHDGFFIDFMGAVPYEKVIPDNFWGAGGPST